MSNHQYCKKKIPTLCFMLSSLCMSVHLSSRSKSLSIPARRTQFTFSVLCLANVDNALRKKHTTRVVLSSSQFRLFETLVSFIHKGFCFLISFFFLHKGFVLSPFNGKEKFCKLFFSLSVGLITFYDFFSFQSLSFVYYPYCGNPLLLLLLVLFLVSSFRRIFFGVLVKFMWNSFAYLG